MGTAWATISCLWDDLTKTRNERLAKKVRKTSEKYQRECAQQRSSTVGHPMGQDQDGNASGDVGH